MYTFFHVTVKAYNAFSRLEGIENDLQETAFVLNKVATEILYHKWSFSRLMALSKYIDDTKRVSFFCCSFFFSPNSKLCPGAVSLYTAPVCNHPECVIDFLLASLLLISSNKIQMGVGSCCTSTIVWWCLSNGVQQGWENSGLLLIIIIKNA